MFRIVPICFFVSVVKIFVFATPSDFSLAELNKLTKTGSLRNQVSEKGEIFSEFSERGQNVVLYETRFRSEKARFATDL
jgi:hypothetical protein